MITRFCFFLSLAFLIASCREAHVPPPPPPSTPLTSFISAGQAEGLFYSAVAENFYPDPVDYYSEKNIDIDGNGSLDLNFTTYRLHGGDRSHASVRPLRSGWQIASTEIEDSIKYCITYDDGYDRYISVFNPNRTNPCDPDSVPMLSQVQRFTQPQVLDADSRIDVDLAWSSETLYFFNAANESMYINGTPNLHVNEQYSSGEWPLETGFKFIGIRYDDGADNYFGWLKIQVNSGISIKGWAIQKPAS